MDRLVQFWKPSAEQIDDIAAGREENILDAFGRTSKVVEIFAHGTDIHGKKFVCVYVEIGRGTRMSASMKEGELYRTLDMSSKFLSVEIDKFERELPIGKTMYR